MIEVEVGKYSDLFSLGLLNIWYKIMPENFDKTAFTVINKISDGKV